MHECVTHVTLEFLDPFLLIVKPELQLCQSSKRNAYSKWRKDVGIRQNMKPHVASFGVSIGWINVVESIKWQWSLHHQSGHDQIL
jgi:hypothetical protein